MELRTTLAISLLAVPVALLAQPTLSFPADAPTLGSSYVVKYAAYQPAGTAGPSQTWDFGDLSADSTGIIEVVAPNSVPGGSGYPNATAALVAPDGTEIYEANSIGLFLLGGELFGQSAPFTDPAQILAYPCTFQTGWEDNYGGSADVGGIPIELVGSVIGFADAYGTLALPEGVVTDVLRVQRTDVLAINTFLGNFELTTEIFAFYKAGIDVPIMEISSLTGDLLGEPLNVQILQWIDLSTVSVNELAGRTLSMNVFPNPAVGQLQVDHQLVDAGMVIFDLIDMQGGIARQFSQMGGAAGPQRITLDLSGLSPGVYVLRITDQNGRTGNRLVNIH